MLKSHLRRFHTPVGLTLRRDTAKQTQQDFNIEDLAQVFENDPSLEAFYDVETVNRVNKYLSNKNGNKTGNAAVLDDEYNFSLIEGMEKFEDVDFSPSNTVSTTSGMPQTMKTEDFMKLLNKDGEIGDTPAKQPVAPASNPAAPTVDRYAAFKTFLKSMESPTKPLRIKHLDQLVHTESPLIVISKLRTPTLNLALEKYIYDNYPDVKDPLNKFSKRLMIYKNSPCIVVGKNQNVFREVNFRYASNIGVPILRRFSGGGTVVHDLGNVNFSFMCPKDEFDRVGFTVHLIEAWNASPQAPIKLNINEKGDMINNANSKKVSGSAFQISKGKSLHHGTMLLDSDLEDLGKLLRVNKKRLDGITDKSTNSIPSPIMNTGIEHDEFISLLCESFTSGFGLPGKAKTANADNVLTFISGSAKCQVVLVDDLMKFPDEVYEIEKELKSWEWTFGKTPRFEQKLHGLDGGELDVKFTVAKGVLVGLELQRKDGGRETRFGPLERELKAGKEVKFTGRIVCALVEDVNLREEMELLIDENYKYPHENVV